MLLNNIRNRLHTLTQTSHRLSINVHLIQLTHPRNASLKPRLLLQLISSRRPTLTIRASLHIIKMIRKLSLIKLGNIPRRNRRPIKISPRHNQIKRRAILHKLATTLTKKTSNPRPQLDTLALSHVDVKPLTTGSIPRLKIIAITIKPLSERSLNERLKQRATNTTTSTPNNNIRRHINHLTRLFKRFLLLLKHALISAILSISRSPRRSRTLTSSNPLTLPRKPRPNTLRNIRKRHSVRRNRSLLSKVALHRNGPTPRSERTSLRPKRASPNRSTTSHTCTLSCRHKQQRSINRLITEKLLSSNPETTLLIRLIRRNIRTNRSLKNLLGL